MTKLFFRSFITFTLLCVATLTALAQADVSSATVKGVVTDPQGAAVANAVVIAKSLEQGATRSDTTNADGEFQLHTLRPGLYEITVEAQGFAKYLIKETQLTVGQTANFEIKLEVGRVTNEVTVTSAAPLIEVERTQQSNTIERRQVENLPNVGRTFTSYVYTLPGVANSDAPRAQLAGRVTGFTSSGFSIGGSNGRNNLVTVDGGENEYGSGGLRFAISPEVVQEFQVNRNSFAAEFGFTAGTAVNVVTKSGTNNFHGSGYLFYRSQQTSARNAFDILFPGRKSFEQRVFPGFTLGGPVVKNKLFFFTNYERLKEDNARFRSYTPSDLLPPSVAQAAFLARLDAATDANVRRISANLRNALTTNATTFPATFGLLRTSEGTFNGLQRLNTWSTRADYNISERDSLNGRFTLSRNYTNDLGLNNLLSPSNNADLAYRDYSTVLTWTHNYGSNLINVVRGQFSPNNSAVTAPPDADPRVTIGIGGLATFGRNFGTPYVVSQHRFQIEDTLTWIRGNHTVKFGGSYRPVQYTFRNDLWFSGQYDFLAGIYPATLAVPAADQVAFVTAVTAAGLTAPTLNSLQAFNHNLPFLYRQGFNNPLWLSTGHYIGAFAQTTWKVHPRLTLDIGGRVDYDGEPEPVPRNTYFSPRFGFSWDVAGDHKTVVRGGSGVFYSPIYIQIPGYTSILNGSGRYINQIARSGIRATPTAPLGAADIWREGIARGKYPNSILTEAEIRALGISTAAGAPGRVLFELDPDYENNYSIQANFGIQRQLTQNTSLEVAYQMYHGLHIQMPVGLDYIEVSPQPATRDPRLGPLYRVCQVADNCRRVSDPTITQFTNYESRGSSIYHGMTASLTRRFSNNVSFQANYTFSKAIDDTTDFNSAFAPPFPTRLTTERALSTFDIRHNFVLSGVLLSPWKNWALRDFALSPVIFIRSGIPFSLVTGTDINGDTRGGTDRLFYIGRNTGLGPNYRSVDMALRRSFRFKQDGGLRIEFSAAIANLFNRTNFAAVREIISADPNHPDYQRGTVRLEGLRARNFRVGEPLSFTSAFNPRQILWGLKLAF